MSDIDNVRFQKKPISNRTIIMNIDESDIQNPEERSFVQKYKQMCQQANVAEAKLLEIRIEIDNLTPSEGINYTEKMKALKEARYEANNNLNKYVQRLRNLEEKEKEIFNSLVDRERQKLRIQKEQAGRLALAACVENERKKTEEIINSIQKRREENLRKQERLSQIEKPIQAKATYNKNEGNNRGFFAVFTSILFSILGLFEFYLIYGVITLISGLLFILISNIPIVSTLVEWLFRIREDTPAVFAMLFGVTLAYVGTMATLGHIKESTQKLALMIMGISLVAMNIFYLILNLVYHETIFINIVMSIAGIIIFVKGKNT